jgi:hypothetical protein
MKKDRTGIKEEYLAQYRRGYPTRWQLGHALGLVSYPPRGRMAFAKFRVIE